MVEQESEESANHLEEQPSDPGRGPYLWPKEAVVSTRRAVVHTLRDLEIARSGDRRAKVLDRFAQTDMLLRRAAETFDLFAARGYYPLSGPDGEAPYSIYRLEELLREIRVVCDAVGGASSHGLKVELAQGANTWPTALADVLQSVARDPIRPRPDVALGDDPAEHATAFIDFLAAQKLAYETEAARDEALKARDETRKAAGATSEAKLALHFARYASDERRSANWLRLGCIAALVVVTGFAALVLADESGGDAVDALPKLFLTIPIAALAAYLGREASRHRAAAQWASELEVQLLTVDAYTEPLPEHVRDALRGEFGRRVFSATALATDANAPSAGTDVAGLVESLAGLLRASTPRQSDQGPNPTNQP